MTLVRYTRKNLQYAVIDSIQESVYIGMIGLPSAVKKPFNDPYFKEAHDIQDMLNEGRSFLEALQQFFLNRNWINDNTYIPSEGFVGLGSNSSKSKNTALTKWWEN